MGFVPRLRLDDATGMKHRRLIRPIRQPSSAFAGFRFPPEVILIAVRWYLRYGLSYRDLEELLAERGIEVDHVTLFRWVQRFTPLLVEAARPYRHSSGSRWFVDETYVKVAGRWRYACRAIDQFGQVIDVFVSKKRDTRMLRPNSSPDPSALTARRPRSRPIGRRLWLEPSPIWPRLQSPPSDRSARPTHPRILPSA
jgi:hypothetical protein